MIFILLYSALVRPHHEYAIQANCPYLKKDIYRLERIKRTATRWLKGVLGHNYEESLNLLKLLSLKKRRTRNDLILTHKVIYNQIDLEASQRFKFSRRPGLRRSLLRLLQQSGRTRGRKNSSTSYSSINTGTAGFQKLTRYSY